MTPFVRSQSLCFGNSLSHGNEGFFLHFSTSLVQSRIQLTRYFCLINFGKKSCLFEKVTYVTALKWTSHTLYTNFITTPLGLT